jgi:predicted CoA-binding protein
MAPPCAYRLSPESPESSEGQMAALTSASRQFDRGARSCYTALVPLGGIHLGASAFMESTDVARLIPSFVGKRVWAVVGASQDPAKFGYRIFRNLKEAGYTVYPVNPKGGELLGAQVYPSLADLPAPPEVVDTVVPPAITEHIVKEMHALGLTRIWMQPGSESEAAILYCHEHGIQVVHDACAMVHRWQWN